MTIENILTGEEKEEYYWLQMPEEEYIHYDDSDLYGDSYNLEEDEVPDLDDFE